ncbi:hypothetical protein Trydic_g644 [Trypoxylus dichotomus]
MLLQITLTFIATLAVTHGTPPPGYKPKPQDPDLHPPKYKYGYNIADEKGTTQGKVESRDGIYAQGRYYVQGSSSIQNVEYLADDWGYHPYVEYSNVGPHSKTVTQIALGKEAVEALHKNNNDISTKLDIRPVSSSSSSSPSSPRKEYLTTAKPINVLYTVKDATNQHLPQPVLLVNNNGVSNKPIIQDNSLASEIPLNQLNAINTAAPLTASENLNIKTAGNQASIIGEGQNGILLQQTLGNIGNNVHQQNSAGQLIVSNEEVSIQPLQQYKGSTENPKILFDLAQQSFQNSNLELDTSKENKNTVFLNQPQQTYFQTVAQQNRNLENADVNQQKLTSNVVLTNTLVNNEKLYQTSSNSALNQEIVGNNENTFLPQQGVPLIFLTQEQLNKGIVLLPQNFQAQYQINKDNSFVQSQLLNGKSTEVLVGQNNINTDIQEVGTQNLSPIALPLVYHSVPQPSHYVNIESIQNKTREFNQLTEQQTDTLQNVLTSENLGALFQSLEKESNSKQLTTAALYESGAEPSIKETSQEDTNYSGAYGEKISTSLVNHPQVITSNPSRLIESTKNLITGFDVLSINGAAETKGITPLSLVSDTSQQQFSITKTSSESAFENALSTTSVPLLSQEVVTPISLLKNPIVVADLENENYQSSLNSIYYNQQQQQYKQVYSTTENILAGLTSHNHDTTESTVIVTPRPIHSKFLAPITAGVQLQNAEKAQQQKFLVEVQESVPYYVGKFEYVQNNKEQEANDYQDILRRLNISKTLIDTPIKPNVHSTAGKITSQTKAVITNNIDQQQEQGQIQQITVASGQTIKNNGYSASSYTNTNVETTKEVPQILHQINNVAANLPRVVEKIIPQPYPVEKIVEKPVHVPIEVTKYVDRPYAVHVPVTQHVPYPVEKVVEKYINRPYPVHVPVHIPVQVPVTVEKKVPVPYPVEKIVEKPVTKIIEKPVPQPYPVEKIVEKKVPVEVAKYIDRPYPVKVPVAQPYPVEKVVEKIVNKPYPVPVQVFVPQPYPVEKIVEKKVPVQVNKYIDRPYPVNVPIAQPYAVEKVVNKVINKPYPIPVLVPSLQVQTLQQNIQQPTAPQSYLFPLNIKHAQTNHQAEGARYQHFFISNPYLYAPGYQSTQNQIDQNSIASNTQDQKIQYIYETIQPSLLHQTYNFEQKPPPPSEYGAPITHTIDKCKKLNTNEYIGLVPPKDSQQRNVNGLRKRQAKSSFESPKLEYGFLPPLIPSQEIDENGKPVEDKAS